MNPDLLDQTELFTQTILLPSFVDLQEILEAQENSALIISTAVTEDEAVNTFLAQMHPSRPLMPSILTEAIAAQGWIGPSLYIEAFGASDPEKPSQGGKYCLSLEFTLDTTQNLCITPIAAYICSWEDSSSIQFYVFDNAHQRQLIQDIDSAAIIDYFAESFEAFQTYLLAIEPEPTLIDLDSSLPLPHSEPFSSPSEPTHAAALTIITQQRAHELTQQHSDPQFPSHSKPHPKLGSTTQINPVKDRYGQIINLTLEYGPYVPESDFIEQLTRLSHYQSLRQLAHLHRFVQIQMQEWHKQNGQPSSGAIALNLSQKITQLADHLRQRIEILNETQLHSEITLDLQMECAFLEGEQHQQKTFLTHIEQNPLLGYLEDPALLEQNAPLELHVLLSDPTQPIDLHARYLKGNHNIPLLAYVDSCGSDKYLTYQKRNPERSGPNCFVEYAITQKLYPNRPVSIGPASQAVYPCLELLWNDTDEASIPHTALTQIWRIYPMLRHDPVQWFIIAATTDTQCLKTIALENGQIAQEGTSEYLRQSLQMMAQHPDEYTQTLVGLATEAIEQRGVKYLNFHQTQDLQTGEPRDIVKLQFQLER